MDPTTAIAESTATDDNAGSIPTTATSAPSADTNGDVSDLGWTSSAPSPVVRGLENDDLWLLLRRFDKQLYHVKQTDRVLPGGLDLHVASEDEFSPDKLRCNIERLYMTVIVGLAAAGKHIARVRSWKETRRTAAFCGVYFIAWTLDMLVPTLVTVLMTLILYPPARVKLFPPAPLALVDAASGGVKKPTAGVLGSDNSLTGAPEKQYGEAVEQEARSFVTTIGAIGISSIAGKHEPGDEEEDLKEKKVPDPTDSAIGISDAKESAHGQDASIKHDKAKRPVEEAIWEKARPTMHIIGDVADMWERLGNALSPTPPFAMTRPKFKLAGVLAPVLLGSFFVTPYMLVKGVGFGVGVGFFGDPIFQATLRWLNKNIPDWPKYLDIRNNILRGVPTNAQLTITLLRIGEASKAPLPPPPSHHDSEAPEHAAKPIDTEELPLAASNGEIESAIQPDGASLEEEPQHKQKKGSKIISFFKGTTRTSVNTALSADPLRASVGSKPAQRRLGVLARKPTSAGPVEFPCRHRGKKGVLYVLTEAASPCISFRRYDKYEEIVVPIPDITEIRKHGGLGWKVKLAVGWSMDRAVVDGIEIVTKDGGKYLFTAVRTRDMLFNRLIAMGSQKWESW